jgi:ferritin-like metal-binding protein YciE
MELKSIEDLLLHVLADIKSAEEQLIVALPRMAKAATDPNLKQGFTQHLEQTKEHLNRLELIIGSFEDDIDEVHCKAMEGLIKEGDEVLQMQGDSDIKDIAIMGAAQKIEHYEIAAYTSAMDLANKLKMTDVAETLKRTLEEEGYTAEKLRLLEEEMA